LLHGAYELAEAGKLPGGTLRNRADLAASVTWDDAVSETMRMLLCDAQTSGGLLISTPREHADQLVNELARVGTPAAARIGEVIPGEPGTIQVLRG
jgi:selenide,water dikinase